MKIAHTFIKRDAAGGLDLGQAPGVTLTLAERRRSRQRLDLDEGRGELGMAIERGQTLRDGDVLVADDGTYVVVRAALEDVARVTAATPWQLARAAYHLGNRHVLLEIAEQHLQFEYDAVLVDMLAQLGGVTAARLRAVFEPDVGAYGGGHRHGHDDSFDDDYALAQAAYHAHEAHSHAHSHAGGHGHVHAAHGHGGKHGEHDPES
ncbi:urease accessory protein UreE [Bordetella bronchiseptica]|uniref:urease accessory protein UreE n=1 Tax=Bordetella bronchiseptica TaxID=518 RepID=UPI00045AA815|nr:urease accessory protein UreE [Bordetella bronchiseptica]AOB28433.1 urease accessory protein UreE [Bordetella bronchiseptica]AZW45779.1 urease accessory protein UreE [Bordetella bronchiseptica]KCV66773.1 urease accessory protein UreE [Bordetella bronchiseptica 99-R-0433]MBN3266679.1 urease accessory protein UreE [Bordetella bronchiseptica]